MSETPFVIDGLVRAVGNMADSEKIMDVDHYFQLVSYLSHPHPQVRVAAIKTIFIFLKWHYSEPLFSEVKKLENDSDDSVKKAYNSELLAFNQYRKKIHLRILSRKK